jgi:uncharacterized protein YqjF (DUF2071 family)
MDRPGQAKMDAGWGLPYGWAVCRILESGRHLKLIGMKANKKFVGECHLNRPIGELILRAGLKMENARNYYMKGPKVMNYLHQGTAAKQD